VGAATTAIALIVIVSAKFAEGAWITIIVIPLTIMLLKAVRSYYDELESRLRKPGPLDLRGTDPPIVLVATEGWTEMTDKALALAMSLSRDVIGVHLSQLEGPDDDARDLTLQAQWKQDVEEPARRAGLNPPRLMVLRAEYRAIHEPLLKLAKDLQAKFPGRRIAVLIPELVKQRWYQTILHTFRASRLRNQLLKQGGPGLTVINVPWYLDAVETPARIRAAA
ncbi:MAG TPA: APC family permease, partial [Beijerinckiaceae bacterium]|nr:APC family permease [Beijerinckiaceae bacterium]